MKGLRHFRTSRELRSLHEVLKEWVRLNGVLARQWLKGANDLPWWYNERALMSVLAGAIWRKKGHAFEEFSETKLQGLKKEKANGRVDLWFETSSGREFRAEVKHAEIPITRPGNQLTSLHALMKRAVKDARCNPADGGYSRRLAIAFAVPYFKSGLPAKTQKARVHWFLSLVEEVDHDAIAWVFSPSTKLPAPNGYACPGIVIWIKTVKRSP